MKKLIKNLNLTIFASAIFMALFFVSCMSSKYTLSDYDTNGNGKLNKSEFSQTLDATNAFKLADADGDGKVSYNEWNQYLDVIGFFTKYDADGRKSFKKWDSNHNETLSKKELYNGIFQTVDNGAGRINSSKANDGFIERAEWNQWYDKDLF